MCRIFTVVAALVGLLIAPAGLSAKGETLRIVISGGDLAAPVEITDSAVIVVFRIWAGPGTSTNNPQSLNVDWSRGTVKPPEGAPVYQVSFVTTRGPYIVRYAIDAANAGFVYLPGKTDAEYDHNVWLILRGVEGGWFHARVEWEKLANPLIAKAPKKR
jgi:hypothetical protein